MKIVFIYVLKDPDTNVIRYVGKSLNPKRRLKRHLHTCKNRNYHSANWINSLLNEGKEPLMEIIEEANENNWEEREKYWISYYRDKFDLTNINEGGGFGGITYGFKGKKHRPESIEKMKKTRTGVSINQNDKNGNRKKALRNYHDKNKKPILQYDLDGNFIKEWECAVDAGSELKLGHSNITRSCKNKKSCGNYMWIYKSGEISKKIEKYKISDKKFNKKPVLKFDKEMLLLDEYNSVTEAQEKTGIKVTSITNCLSGLSKTAGGFIWKYKK